MKRSWMGLALGLPVGAVFLAVGCGDDEVFRDTDAGGGDGGALVEADTPRTDAAVDGGSACGDGTGAPPRALMWIDNFGTTELVAFDLTSKSVAGRYTFKGFGAVSTQGSEPFLLEQSEDVVGRLDARDPWKVLSTWSVGDDAGKGYADPAAMVVPTCGKGYVVRFKRNTIDVLDTSKNADGGAPAKTIDLSSLVQPTDTDGLVDMVAGVYVPQKQRVYVLLGNMDLNKVDPKGAFTLCGTSKPTLIAIDPAKDEVVSLGGTGPGGGITLEGYNPNVGSSLVYDAVRDRMLVLEAGCNAPLADAGPGDLVRRRIEEVDLGTGQVKTLLSLDDQDYPLGFRYLDATHAIVSFFGAAYAWNPQENKLGATIANAPDTFAPDRKGNLIGTKATYFADGGAGPLEVWRMPLGDAGTPEKLGENPFTDNSGFVSGVEVWP